MSSSSTPVAKEKLEALFHETNCFKLHIDGRDEPQYTEIYLTKPMEYTIKNLISGEVYLGGLATEHESVLIVLHTNKSAFLAAREELLRVLGLKFTWDPFDRTNFLETPTGNGPYLYLWSNDTSSPNDRFLQGLLACDMDDCDFPDFCRSASNEIRLYAQQTDQKSKLDELNRNEHCTPRRLITSDMVVVFNQ